MQTNTKAFTLVEMLVAMAVSTIIIAATYASYDLVATQYKKNIDVAEMHTSGRAIMQMIERDVRMADFKYRDQDANVTYGPITAPLVIKDSGDKCCDEVTVIYDYYDEDSKKVERIRIRYWAESYSSNKGNRYRLYKQIDVLGRNNAILANPIIGSKDLLADFVEDLQISDAIAGSPTSPSCDYSKVCDVYNGLKVHAEKVKIDQQNRLKKDPKSNLMSRRYVRILNWRGEVQIDTLGRSRTGKGCSDYGFWVQLYWTPLQPSSRLKIKDFSAETCTGVNSCFTRKDYWVSKVNSMCLYGDGTSNGNGFKLKPKNCSNEQYYISGTPALSLKSFSNGKWNDFKCENTTKIPSLVNIVLTLRTRNEYGKDRQFKKKDYHSGNYNLDKTDKYKRDTFSSTVTARNLAL